MPRRPLWLLTAVVLALHWLALAGMPLQSHTAALHTPGPVFSTRTLAAPPPPAPPPTPTSAAATPKAPAVAAPVPAQRVPGRKKPAAPEPVPAQEPSASASRSTERVSALVEPARWDEMGAPLATGTEAPAEPSTTAESADTTPLAIAGTSAAPTAAAEPAPEPALAPPPPASAISIEAPGTTAHHNASASAAPAVRIAPPQRLLFDVSGEVKKFHYNARAELLWQHDGQQYQARQEISLLFLGSRTQSSTGALGDGGLRPQRFADRSRSEQAAHFDYAQGQVTFSANTPPAAMVAGTQDRLSVFIQLGALLAAAPERYPPGTRISLATVSARAADVWAFTVEDEEALHLPAGTISARKLQRLPRREHEHDQKAELWLAPALGYLPVRIRITQANGDFADLRLRSHAPP